MSRIILEFDLTTKHAELSIPQDMDELSAIVWLISILGERLELLRKETNRKADA
jgi:hypothetical protein